MLLLFNNMNSWPPVSTSTVSPGSKKGNSHSQRRRQFSKLLLLNICTCQSTSFTALHPVLPWHLLQKFFIPSSRHILQEIFLKEEQYHQILSKINECITLLRTTFSNSNPENKRKVLRQVKKIPKEKVKLEKPNTKGQSVSYPEQKYLNSHIKTVLQPEVVSYRHIEKSVLWVQSQISPLQGTSSIRPHSHPKPNRFTGYESTPVLDFYFPTNNLVNEWITT